MYRLVWCGVGTFLIVLHGYYTWTQNLVTDWRRVCKSARNYWTSQLCLGSRVCVAGCPWIETLCIVPSAWHDWRWARNTLLKRIYACRFRNICCYLWLDARITLRNGSFNKRVYWRVLSLFAGRRLRFIGVCIKYMLGQMYGTSQINSGYEMKTLI